MVMYNITDFLLFLFLFLVSGFCFLGVGVGEREVVITDKDYRQNYVYCHLQTSQS